MGLFDFFQKQDKEGEETTRRSSFKNFYQNETTDTPTQKGPVTVFYPKSFKDVETIITTLKNNGQVLLHLNELEVKTAYRVLDMVCGAVFALNGGIYEIENNVFMLTPYGVEVK